MDESLGDVGATRTPSIPADGESPGVVVVGAGPVGLTTALLLARHGIASVVLDAASPRGAPAPESKAICQQRDVLDIWDRVGVASEILEEGVTWTRGRTFYQGRELFSVEFDDPGESPTPPWVNISQSSTVRYLQAAADRHPLVDVRFGHEVVDVEPDDDGGGPVTVDVQDSTGTRRHLQTRWLVAADGSHSTVRRLLAVAFPGRSFEDQFLIVDIRAQLPFPNERHFHFDPPWNPGRQVLIHECPGNLWRIDWQVPADYDLQAEQASGALDERVRRVVGDVAYEIVWLSVYRFHERLAERFRCGRVFLVGDAAHLVAPFGARGLNSGVQDADNLAWKLALVERGVVSGDGAEMLLDSYDIERRAAAAENVAITTSTMSFLVPADEEGRRHRQAVLEAASQDPSASAMVDSGKLAEPFPYTRSPLTTPAITSTSSLPSSGDDPDLAPRVGLAPGSLFPDAPCSVPGRAKIRRVRDLFGSGFVVLAADGTGLAQAQAEAVQVTEVLKGLAVECYDIAEISSPARQHTLADLTRREAPRTYVVRPDGHLAACLDADAAGTAAAIMRACGTSRPPFEPTGTGGTVDISADVSADVSATSTRA